jgi:hypothetical protein
MVAAGGESWERLRAVKRRESSVKSLQHGSRRWRSIRSAIDPVALSAITSIVASMLFLGACGSDSSNAATPEPTSTVPINVVQEATDGTVASQVQFTSAKEAAADASKKAGFTIVNPTRIPAGYQLILIDISPAARNGLLRARLRIAGPDQKVLSLLRVNVPFQFDGADADHAIATPGSGATIYRVASEKGVEHTLLTPKHGYTLTVLAPEPIDQDEAVKILSALPLD